MDYKIEGKKDERMLKWTNLEDVKRVIRKELMSMIEAQSVEAVKILHYLNLKRQISIGPVKKSVKRNKIERLINNIVYLFKPLNRAFESGPKLRPEEAIPDLKRIQNIYKDLINRALDLVSKGYIKAEVGESGEIESSLYAAYDIDLRSQKIYCTLGIDIKNRKYVELS